MATLKPKKYPYGIHGLIVKIVKAESQKELRCLEKFPLDRLN